MRNEENFPNFITKVDEFHPSAWDPHARAKVMEEYGVDSAVLYPNLGFIGPDIYRVQEGSSLEFQVEIASTYNDWILDWEHAEPIAVHQSGVHPVLGRAVGGGRDRAVRRGRSPRLRDDGCARRPR